LPCIRLALLLQFPGDAVSGANHRGFAAGQVGHESCRAFAQIQTPIARHRRLSSLTQDFKLAVILSHQLAKARRKGRAPKCIAGQVVEIGFGNARRDEEGLVVEQSRVYIGSRRFGSQADRGGRQREVITISFAFIALFRVRIFCSLVTRPGQTVHFFSQSEEKPLINADNR
jgi:hypothetical protein